MSFFSQKQRMGAAAQSTEAEDRARLSWAGVQPGWRLMAAARRTKSKPSADQSSVR